MENLLQPYEGSGPYVFVSYSHKDSDRVFPIIQHLQAEELKILCDKNFDATDNFSDKIAIHMKCTNLSNNF